jgi:hypothetical protein
MPLVYRPFHQHIEQKVNNPNFSKMFIIYLHLQFSRLLPLYSRNDSLLNEQLLVPKFSSTPCLDPARRKMSALKQVKQMKIN